MRRLLVTLLAPLPAMFMANGCADDSTAGRPGAMEDYVPDAPIAYDAHYLDGSFEDNQGFGWDTCHTRTPGKLSHLESGGAAGSAYLRQFETGGCEGGCTPTNPSASHSTTGSAVAPSATAKMGLYSRHERGRRRRDGRAALLRHRFVCQQDSVLAEIHLTRLPLSSTWSTRCVTITGPGADTAIGLSVSGGTHKIGIDAIRLGAPCHASP